MIPRAFAACLALPLLALPLAACETEDPTQAVVENGFPAPPDGGNGPQMVVYRAWWVVSPFADPVPAGMSSAVERVIPGDDYAYALLAPGWDPSSSPPATLVAVRSKTKLSVARGDTLHIKVSDATFDGDCAAGSTLPPADADFITTHIFPGDFAGAYDPATCTTKPVDAGSD
jgi:hypothetical protein